MNELVTKLRAVEREIAAEKGPFTFFALFLREESPNRWDVVAAAPWFGSDKMEPLRFLADRLQAHLTPDEVILLSRIVIINEDNPYLGAIHEDVQAEHGLLEVRDQTFFGQEIEHGYIITSDPLQPVATT